MHHAILVTNIQLAKLSPQHPFVQIENRVIAGSDKAGWMLFINRSFFGEARQLIEIQAVGHGTRLFQMVPLVSFF